MARRETAARRYADAAFEIGRADRTLEGWERDLLTLREALQNEQLRRLIQHPAIPFAEKERVLRQVAGAGGTRAAQPGAAHGPPRTAGRHRCDGGSLPGAGSAPAWDRRWRRCAPHSPLSDDERTAIAERLHALTGDRIEIDEVVDESLIGGVSVRIGDQLYDASVRSRLERLRARLTAA